MISQTKKRNYSYIIGSVYIAYMFITFFSVAYVDIFYVYRKYADYVSLFFLVFVILLKKNITLKNIFQLLFVLAVFTFISCFNNGGIGSNLSAFTIYLMFFALPEFQLDKEKKNLIVVFAMIFLVFAFIRSFAYRSDWLYHRWNDVNPNTMGMFVMFSVGILVLFLDFKSIKNIIILIASFVLGIISLIFFESRVCLVTTVLLAFILPLYRIINRKVLFVVAVAIIVLGTLFPIAYMYCYRNDINLTFLNKTLYTGREAIWDNVFSLFGSNVTNWLVGLGSHTDFGSVNVHNNYLAVIVNFGITGYVLYYGFLLLWLKSVLLYSKDLEEVKSALIFIVTVLVLGFTEITTFWAVIYPFLYLFVSASSSSLLKNGSKNLSGRLNARFCD